jgi:hypothetical protein
METNLSASQPAPAAAQAAGEISAPALDYAPPPPAARLRRWLRPGSAGFFGLVLALTVAGTWWGWKGRLKADERAFHERAEINTTGRLIWFSKPPDRASLHHLARLPGTWRIFLQWPGNPGPDAPLVFRGLRLPNVIEIHFLPDKDVDPWLIEFSRPDSGLKSIASLALSGNQVTDAGLKELARPDSGLKSLASLNLGSTQVTDAGLKELARPDSGLKSLASLNLVGTHVTDAGIEALRKARPGLIVYR